MSGIENSFFFFFLEILRVVRFQQNNLLIAVLVLRNQLDSLVYFPCVSINIDVSAYSRIRTVSISFIGNEKGLGSCYLALFFVDRFHSVFVVHSFTPTCFQNVSLSPLFASARVLYNSVWLLASPRCYSISSIVGMLFQHWTASN